MLPPRGPGAPILLMMVGALGAIPFREVICAAAGGRDTSWYHPTEYKNAQVAREHCRCMSKGVRVVGSQMPDRGLCDLTYSGRGNPWYPSGSEGPQCYGRGESPFTGQWRP